jgi:hypothetical protein
MKTKKSKKFKMPEIPVDESLDKYNDQVLFPGKLKKANEMLRTVGLPKSGKQHK